MSIKDRARLIPHTVLSNLPQLQDVDVKDIIIINKDRGKEDLEMIKERERERELQRRMEEREEKEARKNAKKIKPIVNLKLNPKEGEEPKSGSNGVQNGGRERRTKLNLLLKNKGVRDKKGGDVGDGKGEGGPSSITDSLEWNGGIFPDRDTGEGEIPLVTIFINEEEEEKMCKEGSPLYENLKAVLLHNRVVHLLSLPLCSSFQSSLGVSVDTWQSYSLTLYGFREEIGVPKPIHARWYVLKSFMERYNYTQIFYFEPNIVIRANITEFVDEILDPEDRHIMLLQSVPELYSPEIINLKWASVITSGQTSLWSYRGLVDFVTFHKLFFNMDVLHGWSTVKFQVETQAYIDTVVLGWYSFFECWRPGRDRKICKAETSSGFTLQRVARTTGKFEAQFNVSSGLKPRLCNSTSWSESGWCMFQPDDVSITKEIVRIEGNKLPHLEKYRGFPVWINEEEGKLAPKNVIQMLSEKVRYPQKWFR